MKRKQTKRSHTIKHSKFSTIYIRYIAITTLLLVVLLGVATYQPFTKPTTVLGASTTVASSCQWWNIVCLVQNMFRPKSSNLTTSQPTSNTANGDTSEHLMLTKNFVNLADVSAISKYRSCEGHVVVSCDQKETKRSMKHYFRPKSQFLGTNDKVKLYAPFDGIVYKIFRQPDVTEISLYPQSEKSYFNASTYWNFTIQHINLLPNITEGMEVTAGELLGYANFSGQNGSFDINVNKSLSENESGGKSEEKMKAMFEKQKGGSGDWSQYKGNFAGSGIKMVDGWGCPYSDLADVFDFMSADVLADYAAHGVSKDQTSFTKEYRDAHQCVYQGTGPYFNASYNSDGDWAYIK